MRPRECTLESEGQKLCYVPVHDPSANPPWTRLSFSYGDDENRVCTAHTPECTIDDFKQVLVNAAPPDPCLISPNFNCWRALGAGMTKAECAAKGGALNHKHECFKAVQADDESQCGAPDQWVGGRHLAYFAWDRYHYNAHVAREEKDGWRDVTTKEMVSGISPHLGRCPSVVVKNMYGCAEFDCGDAVENSYNKTAPSSLPTPRHAAVRT